MLISEKQILYTPFLIANIRPTIATSTKIFILSRIHENIAMIKTLEIIPHP